MSSMQIMLPDTAHHANSKKTERHPWGAFEPIDRDDCCLSVNRLECFEGQDINVNVRKELRKSHKPRAACWLNYTWGAAKYATKAANKITISVGRCPHNDYGSHACVGGHSATNNEVATTLSDMAGEGDMHRAV